MADPTSPTVIYRQDRTGATLDVLGLNQFTLVLDRSETALTEAGWNYWKASLDGPPHFHADKEQLFFAVEGEGQVTIAGQTYTVTPDCLLHIPMGAMHRTVTSDRGPQAYWLVNAFRDSNKEGKATFNDHVAISKHERRRQADEAAQGQAIDWQRVPNPGTLVRVARTLPQPGTAATTPLIERGQTHRLAASQMALGPEATLSWAAETPAVERIFYGLAGSATLEVDGHAYAFGAGTVLYAPASATIVAHTTRMGCAGLLTCTYLD